MVFNQDVCACAGQDFAVSIEARDQYENNYFPAINVQKQNPFLEIINEA